MCSSLPDPRVAAMREEQWLRSMEYDYFERTVERVLWDAPKADPESLLGGLEAFHRERMEKTPSVSKYPESPPWVDYVRTVDRELQQRLNLSLRQLAILRSMNDYLQFRGFVRAKIRPAEKCRVVYIPQTDRGALHFKNVDDPAPPNWRPSRERPERLPHDDDLVWDGAGNGLHIDDEPDEIFPLPVTTMYRHYANDVPAAVDFLTRYSVFFANQNFVLHDRAKRSVAIEKCSHNFIEIFPPDPVIGFSHVSGMVCRDPNSPQGRYQRAKRQQYMHRFQLPPDGADATFWNACDRAERMLVDDIRALGPVPKAEEVIKLFITPWPNGLNKTGAKLHPEQFVGEYTLRSHGSLIDERTYYRWDRDEELRFPDEPEVYRF